MKIFNDDGNNESEDWLILSDLSMGGFIIFLIIALAYIAKNSNHYKRQGMYDNLKTFSKSEVIDVLEDGTIRFSAIREQSMFEAGDTMIHRSFKEELNKFLPSYFDTLQSMLDDIKEIRIEGHTDTVCNSKRILTERSCYLYNLELSQQRAYKVLEHVLTSDAFSNLNKKNQETMKRILVSVGYSYSQALDADGKYVSITQQAVDKDKSRRVDFHIIIKSPEEKNKAYKNENL